MEYTVITSLAFNASVSLVVGFFVYLKFPYIYYLDSGEKKLYFLSSKGVLAATACFVCILLLSTIVMKIFGEKTREERKIGELIFQCKIDSPKEKLLLVERSDKCYLFRYKGVMDGENGKISCYKEIRYKNEGDKQGVVEIKEKTTLRSGVLLHLFSIPLADISYEAYVPK